MSKSVKPEIANQHRTDRRTLLRRIALLGVPALAGAGLLAWEVATHLPVQRYHRQPSSFTVYRGSDNLVKARNDVTGSIDFSASDATTVIQSALNGLSTGRNWKERVIVKGDFTIAGSIRLPSYTILDVDGRLTLTSDASMFVNESGSSGDTNIEIVNGILDANNKTMADSYHSMINFNNVTEGLVSNCLIVNVSGIFCYGVYLANCTRVDVVQSRVQNGADSGVTIASSTDCNVIESKVNDVGGGSAAYVIIGTPTNHSIRCNIINSSAVVADANWCAQIYRYCDDCWILGGNFQGGTTAGIALGHESYKNTCTEIGAIGVRVNCNAGGIFVYNSYAKLLGCFIYGGTLDGLVIYDATTDVTVEGNTVYKPTSGGNGIVIRGSKCQIVANKLSGKYSCGIKLDSGNPSYNLIADNYISGFGGSIAISSGGNHNVIRGQLLFPVPSNAIVDGGIGNLYDPVIVQGLAGENHVFGDICYLGSDGRLHKAKADSTSTAPARVMATENVKATNGGNYLRSGRVSNSSWNWIVGGELYLSDSTSGAATQTKPTISGHVVQELGYAISATMLDFNPNMKIDAL